VKQALLAICVLAGVAHAEPIGVVQPEEPTSQPSSMRPLGEGVHIQPIVIPQDAEKKKDLRPVFAGAGLVLIAAAFWWNRRQREKFDRSDIDSQPTVMKTEDKA
jgi:hypothetical protein